MIITKLSQINWVLLLIISVLFTKSIVYNTNILKNTEEITHKRWNNFSDILSEYFDHTPLLENVTEGIHKFNEMLSNMFHYGNVSHPDTINKQIDKFHHKIQSFFTSNFPENENVLDTLDKFSNRLSNYLKNVNFTSDKGKVIIQRFYDFTDRNLSDYLEEGETELVGNITARFENFVQRVQNFLSSANLTELEGNKNISLQNELPDYFVVYEHRVYVYDLGENKFSLCNARQIDSCLGKCREKDKILCGCYVVNKKDGKDVVDCVCADRPSECLSNHTHMEMEVNKNKINKDL